MVLPILLAAAGAVFGAASVVQGVKAGRAQRNATRIQREADNLRSARERRSAIRDGRLRFAAAQQNSENQGVGESSSAAGGQGSILTQMNSNVSFIDDQQTAANVSGAFMDKAARAQGQSQMWSSFSNLAFMGAQMDFGGAKPEPVAQPPAMAAPPTAQNNFNLFPAQQLAGRLMHSGYNNGTRPVY